MTDTNAMSGNAEIVTEDGILNIWREIDVIAGGDVVQILNRD